MYRIGIDCVEISRIENTLKNERFQTRFGSAELDEIKSRGEKPVNFASSFAAKEAFSKAVGTGIRGFSLKDVQLIHDELGKPMLLLSDELKEKYKNMSFDISITHTDSLVIAAVIAESED